MRVPVELVAEVLDAQSQPRTLDDSFDAHLEQVAEALAELEVIDPFVGADRTEGMIVTFWVTVEATDEIEGFEKAIIAIRAAIHAAGGATPGWERAQWHVERVSPRDDLIDA